VAGIAPDSARAAPKVAGTRKKQAPRFVFLVGCCSFFYLFSCISFAALRVCEPRSDIAGSCGDGG
jgi:hypothetical protein